LPFHNKPSLLKLPGKRLLIYVLEKTGPTKRAMDFDRGLHDMPADFVLSHSI
jgi:hypothetical protein